MRVDGRKNCAHVSICAHANHRNQTEGEIDIEISASAAEPHVLWLRACACVFFFARLPHISSATRLARANGKVTHKCVRIRARTRSRRLPKVRARAVA